MLLLLQLLWGDGFLSPGGAAEVAELLEGSDITGCRVLDIGAALGAVDELLVTQHGAGHVTGIDIDPVMLNRMDERITRAGLRDRITPTLVEPGPLPFADATFGQAVVLRRSTSRATARWTFHRERLAARWRGRLFRADAGVLSTRGHHLQHGDAG